VEQKQIGFVWIRLTSNGLKAFGCDLYLNSEARSKGIGRQVMLACGAKLQSLGIASIEVCVFDHNKIAQKLYVSLGFKKISYDRKNKQFTLSLNLAGMGEPKKSDLK
jgi:ribosomal protein S18 acetylase RimI-like enzyme